MATYEEWTDLKLKELQRRVEILELKVQELGHPKRRGIYGQELE